MPQKIIIAWQTNYLVWLLNDTTKELTCQSKSSRICNAHTYEEIDVIFLTWNDEAVSSHSIIN